MQILGTSHDGVGQALSRALTWFSQQQRQHLQQPSSTPQFDQLYERFVGVSRHVPLASLSVQQQRVAMAMNGAHQIGADEISALDALKIAFDAIDRIHDDESLEETRKLLISMSARVEDLDILSEHPVIRSVRNLSFRFSVCLTPGD